MVGNVNRNDLEEFQKNLLRKINARFYHEREEDNLYGDDSLEIIPGSMHRAMAQHDEMDIISTDSISHEN